MTENNKVLPLLSTQGPWIKNENNIWLGSTISLMRNIEKFKFPGKLPLDRRKQLISLISKELLDSPLLINPILIKAEDIQPLEKEFLENTF